MLRNTIYFEVDISCSSDIGIRHFSFSKADQMQLVKTFAGNLLTVTLSFNFKLMVWRK